MLHVTNGDIAAELIQRVRPGEPVVPWRDVLHDGPVPAGLGDDELRKIRADFLAEGGLAGRAEALATLTARDEALAATRDQEEIVLWFEHDLYDQLQLIQILDRLDRGTTGTTRLSMICIDRVDGVHPFHGLGQLVPDQMAALWPMRQPVTADQTDLARRAWTAFRAADPTPIVDLIAGDTSALPFLAGALRRWLQEFPGADDGLARSERQALAAVHEGYRTPTTAFVAATNREENPYLGDASFFAYLATLAREPRPLLTRDAAGTLALTADGAAVLGGRLDRVHACGIDRWLGGVHLCGHGPLWRWDEAANSLRRA